MLDALLVRLYRPHVFIPGRGSDEQLGLLYVATAARHHGYTVEVLDDPEVTISRLERIVKERRVRVVGFYTDHDNVFTVTSAISALKRNDSSTLCVAGGPQAREWDQRLLQQSACDIVVRGEGEFSFAAILNHYVRNEGKLEDVRGISWKHHGMVRRNQDADPIDLDRFPIPDRTLNLARRRPTGIENVVTGRGCPFRCTFCYEGRPEARYRTRSLDNVLAELEHLVIERKAHYITILDDVFTLNPKRVTEIAQLFKSLQKKVETPFIWFCEARADIICKKPEMIIECVESGLQRIQIGIETGNQQVLDSYNKKLEIDEVLRAVEICHNADVLSIIGNFIIGGAHESTDTINDSVKLAQDLLEIAPGRMEVSTTLFTPYPGTPMYQHPEEFGLQIMDPDCLTGPGDNYPFTCTKHLTKWEILDARQKFTQHIDNKMKEIMPRVPAKLAERHFSAYLGHSMRTRWFDFFCKYLNYYNYFGLPAWTSDIRPLEMIPDKELEEWKPLRTCHLGATHNGCFVINAGHRRLELSERAGAVLELSGGRLPLRYFQQKLVEQGHNLTPSDIMELFAHFDSDRLVVFSRM